MDNSTETQENTNDLDNSSFKTNFKKKNKKRRFISNARGFARKGIYGRGTHVEEDEFTYFINILSVMQSGFETTDDLISMANNVLDQTIDSEIHLSCNQVVSQVIESSISYTNEKHLERFMEKFSENLRPLCSNNYASHVLQKLVEIAFLRAVAKNNQEKSIVTTTTVAGSDDDDNQNQLNEPVKKKSKISPKTLPEKDFNLSTKFKTEHRNVCAEFVLKVGKFLLNNLEDFVWDPYASHIMRTTIMSLAGIYYGKVIRKSTSTRTNDIDLESTFVVPQEWHDTVKEFINRLQLWPQYSEFPFNEFSSTLLGNLCIALKVVDYKLLKHVGKKILIDSFLKVEGFDDDKKKVEINDDEENREENGGEEHIQLPNVFQSVPAIRLLETLLTVAGKKLFTQLYAMLFTGRIKTLALEQRTNYAVQRLIENIKDKCDFETIFDELNENIEELLRSGNTGIVYSLSCGCLRFQTKQAAYVVALQNALHLTKDKMDSFFLCLIKLKPYEYAIEEKSQSSVNLHGSLIIQNILRFNKPINLVNCILNTPQNQLIEIFTTPNGSFIVNVFLESKFIGEKSREKLLKYFEGYYIDLAITKFGSRILDNIFDIANDNQKMKIAKELTEKFNQLNSTLFGRIVLHKYRLQTYRLSPAQWKASFDRANKVEKLFKDIIS